LPLSGLIFCFPGFFSWKAFKRITDPAELELKKSAKVDAESGGNFKGLAQSTTPLGRGIILGLLDS
jgi:hypothetical protein